MAKYKSLIGRAESIDFPEWLLSDVPAKIDTGAYFSSIHATNIREVKKKNGKKSLKFTLLGNHAAFSYDREIELDAYEVTTIENSFGDKQDRFKVDLKVRIAGKVFKAPFTLADRSTKVFPILIGRTMLNHRFIVDTTIMHIDRQELKKKLDGWLARDDRTEES